MTIINDTVYVFGCSNDKGHLLDGFAMFKLSSAFFSLYNLHCRRLIDYPIARQWTVLKSIGSTPTSDPHIEYVMTSVGSQIFVVGGSLVNTGVDEVGRIFCALGTGESYSYRPNSLLSSMNQNILKRRSSILARRSNFRR